jgi:2-methylcitrate dehydratase PrpD
MNEVRYLTQHLADQILRYPTEALPAAVSAKAIDCVLDSVASCLAGISAPPALAARQMALETFAKGGAPVIGDRCCVV